MNQFLPDFEQITFSDGEKENLAVRLERAAEREGAMTDQARRKVRKISRGMVVGIAAACLLTAGTLAAVLSPSLRSYFDAVGREGQEALEQGIYRLDRSETYNGWTVTLAECVGDEYGVYIWVDVTAPEGTALAEPENGSIGACYRIEQPEKGGLVSGGAVYPLPDEDPLDNKISFCIENTLRQGLQGESVVVAVGPILDTWWTDPETERAQYHEGSETTQAVRDHVWTFKDVKLDYPDQTVRLSLNQEVPYLDGFAALTGIEVSPLSAAVRIEGGSCEDHHGPKDRATETEGQGPQAWFACWDALGFQLHMKDGRVLTPPTGVGSACQDGKNAHYDGIPYVEGRFQYADEHSNTVSPRIIDPAQVDYVTVCGVDIPLK